MSNAGLIAPDGTPVTVDETTGNVVRVPDPTIEAAKRSWSDLGYLAECFSNFLMAIQKGIPKDYHYKDKLDWVSAGAPRWCDKDVFESWLKDQEAMLEWRLVELEQKFGSGKPADLQLIKMLDGGELSDSAPFLGRRISAEHREIYEWILRKSQEAIKKYKLGAYCLNDVVIEFQRLNDAA